MKVICNTGIPGPSCSCPHSLPTRATTCLLPADPVLPRLWKQTCLLSVEFEELTNWHGAWHQQGCWEVPLSNYKYPNSWNLGWLVWPWPCVPLTYLVNNYLVPTIVLLAILRPRDSVEHSCILSIELTVHTMKWHEVRIMQWLFYVQHSRSPVRYRVCSIRVLPGEDPKEESKVSKGDNSKWGWALWPRPPPPRYIPHRKTYICAPKICAWLFITAMLIISPN